jgi:co-chaperonin GroES (HSP10)
MSIKPVGHRILVKPGNIDDELKTSWGFEIIGDKRLEKTGIITGTLVAVGNQAWKAYGKDFTGTPWAEVGDKVMFAQHAGRFVYDPDTNEEFLLMCDDDLTAVITKDNK